MNILSVVTAVIMSVSSTVSTSITDCQSLFFYEIPDEQTVTCSVVAENISLGNIIEPCDVFFNEENCAEIFVELLENEGYTPVYSGTTSEWFYLSAIEGVDTSGAEITEASKSFLEEKGIKYTDTVAVESVLSEFDFTESSGWIFTVNGKIPSIGMCDYTPENGDVIELHFTLCYGEDILQ